MDPETLELLRRAHAVFGTPSAQPTVNGADNPPPLDQRLAGNAGLHTGGGQPQYRAELTRFRNALATSAGNDTELRKILAQLAADHAEGHQRTRTVLDAAGADPAPAANTPAGQRELLARQAAYTRQGHDAIRQAHSRARRTTAALRALRYRRNRPHEHRVSPELLRRLPHTRGAKALKHALTQLGVNYVWGGTTPGKGLDCSGLVQYAWREAGINLPRTSQAQMNFGAAVPRADIQPGDLVFPSSAAGGHVQMYAGNGKVIEAPYSGATVRITQMPSQVMAIRRPL